MSFDSFALGCGIRGNTLMNLKLEPCKPPVWARNGHIQTIMAYLLPSQVPEQTAKKILIPLPDGDQLAARLYEGTSSIVILAFHGLTGNADSNYMSRTAVIALEQGHTVLLVNHRGCGEGRDLAKSPYHSGRGEDISEVIKFSRQMFPGKKQIAVGFSLSANALLLLLTGARGDELPDAAITVNAPVDLKATSQLIKSGWNRIYDFKFVQGCRQEIQYKVKNKLVSRDFKIPFWSYLEKVDEVYTAPESGFKDRDDYYASCSTYDRLQKIQTPTVIITSKDDPFIPWQPYLGALRNPHVHLQIEDVGGHLGYLSDKIYRNNSRRWLDYALEEIFNKFSAQLATN